MTMNNRDRKTRGKQKNLKVQKTAKPLKNRRYESKIYIQGVLAYHGFFGKKKTVIGKIRDKQGLLLKPSNGGTLFTKNQYFGYFAV